MLIDTRELTTSRQLHYDVCIVGAGAAGITLARALKSERASICLLESGGFESDRDTQSLYNGRTAGTGLSAPGYLSLSRLRYFGGTTNHWAGMCRPLDAMDFAVRPWVPNSGWPIRRDDLAEYYRRAAELVQFQPFDEHWGDLTSHAESLIPPDGALIGRIFRYSPPTRFGKTYRQELIESDTIDVLLHANVMRLDVNEAGTAVERVRVATLNKRRLSVTAKVFVLATGGVENARLLLVSNDVHKSGIGNGSDRVGRFFMEHPERTMAHVVITSRAVAEDVRFLRRRRAMLCLSEQTQRAHQLLNANIEFGPETQLPESEAGGFPLALRPAIQRIDRIGLEEPVGAEPAGPPAYTRLRVRAESSPNFESRVALEDRDTDALGMRRVRLEFRMGTLESRTFVRTMEIVARELGARQGGRMMLTVDEGAVDVPVGGALWRGTGAGQHHMGTTRMSDRPTEGVVDRHCQVHGVSNLYVAGSSVFPTGGMANPTFTIVALALRMAEHIAMRLAK